MDVFNRLVICLAIGLGAGFLIGAALAQDIREHEHQSVAGKFYAGWLMPNQGMPRMTSCCDNRDCYQTTIKKVGVHWYAHRREDGQWILIPETKLEHNQLDARESPDGMSHVCMPPPGRQDVPYCAVLGAQG